MKSHTTLLPCGRDSAALSRLAAAAELEGVAPDATGHDPTHLLFPFLPPVQKKIKERRRATATPSCPLVAPICSARPVSTSPRPAFHRSIVQQQQHPLPPPSALKPRPAPRQRPRYTPSRLLPDATTPGNQGSKKQRTPRPPAIHPIHGVARVPSRPAPRGGRHARRPLRGRVVHLPPGAAGPDAAEDAGLRVRRRRRLQAHPAERRLLRPQQRQGALLLRRQQLLPAQRPEPAGLRLRRHRHGLRQRPKQQRLHLPRNPERCRVKRHRGRHHRRRGQPAGVGSELLQRQQQRHQRLPGGGGRDSEAGGDPGLLLAPRPVPRRVIEETRHPCPSSQLRLGVLFPGTFLVLVVVAGRNLFMMVFCSVED